MLTITSARNPRIQALRALGTAKGRAETGLFLAEGAKLCGEALRYAEVVTLLTDQEKAEQFAGLVASARDVLLAPASVVAAVAETQTPQGIIAAVRMPAPLMLDEVRGPVVAMDGVQDPGNVGTIIRTAEAAGFCGVLLSGECADAFAPRTVRASMGGVLRLPVWRGNLLGALDKLISRGYFAVSAELGGEAPGAAFRSLGKDVALVIGSEGGGVSRCVSGVCHARVALPMRGQAESLNAAVAAGILMYQIAERVLQ